MAKFVNNEPKFKVGDKVVYSRRRSDPVGWEIESIYKGPLTISKVDTFYSNEKLADVNYFVEGLEYVYSEDWLSYAPTGPKFKIGDLVRVKIAFTKPILEITDVVTITSARDNHTEYSYSLKGEPFGFKEDDLEAIPNEEQLVHDLEICGGQDGCEGCSRDNPYGSGTGCNKLELDAAELIKKLQKKVKELEEKK